MQTMNFKTQLFPCFTAGNHNYGDNWLTTQIQKLTRLIENPAITAHKQMSKRSSIMIILTALKNVMVDQNSNFIQSPHVIERRSELEFRQVYFCRRRKAEVFSEEKPSVQDQNQLQNNPAHF